jgi:hypothetical protein
MNDNIGYNMDFYNSYSSPKTYGHETKNEIDRTCSMHKSFVEKVLNGVKKRGYSARDVRNIYKLQKK